LAIALAMRRSAKSASTVIIAPRMARSARRTTLGATV
jgi:hypothetical protein